MIYTSDHNGNVQDAINTAVAANDNLFIDKAAPVKSPLIVANWNADKSDYDQVSTMIFGDATKGDNGKKSVINCDIPDGFLIGFHKAKGGGIKGVNFQNRSINRDSRYSPQAGIVIDPFCYQAPPDGGYPGLYEYYRGSGSRGGSSCVKIEDCTTNNTTVGIITSPNGHTQNADCINILNHRFGNHKYGLAGCQDQEKGNTLVDCQAWQRMECLLQFNTYGAGKPGRWVVSGGNVAGNVKKIVHRQSAGWFPLMIRELFAENINDIGFWETAVTDTMQECVFKFNKNIYPSFHLQGGGVLLDRNLIRYYGQPERVIIYQHNVPFTEANNVYENEVLRLPKHTLAENVKMNTTPKEGDTVVLYSPKNYTVLGTGIFLNGQVVTDSPATEYKIGVKI